MTQEAAAVLQQFESLGDNCEFGFVQNHYGVTPLGLLRWAGAPLNGLITALTARFADLFRFEDMAITDSGMVLDRKYRLSFHAGTFPADGGSGLRPIPHTVPALEIFEKGARHIAALRRMTLDRLQSRSRIFLYKTRDGLSLPQILRLKQALDLYGPQRLLCVLEACPLVAAGEVRTVAPGVKIGGIAAFADYGRSGDADFPAWLAVCRAAVEGTWEHVDVAPPLFEATAQGLKVYDAALARALVTALYEGILSRAPDPPGLAGHERTLTDGRASLEEMIEAFLRSQEFSARRREFG